jgi:hypothetical protein
MTWLIETLTLKLVLKPPKKLMMPLIISRMLFKLQHGMLALHTGNTLTTPLRSLNIFAY